MPPAATLTTLALSEHLHIEKLCPLCIILPIVTQHPHVVTGPVISGSENVIINGRPAARVTDQGIAVPCCNSNTYLIIKGSSTVFINGRPAARIGDMTLHCNLYPGQLVTNGSLNVNIGDSANMGVGGGGGGGASGGGGGGQGETGEAPGAEAQAKEGEGTAEIVQDGPRKPAEARWELLYEDGAPVRGVLSRYLGPAGGRARELPPDAAGRHQVGDLLEGHGYQVSFTGTKELRGVLQDHQGRPLADAELVLRRAYGPEVQVTTDGGGGFRLDGLVAEEPCEVTVRRGAGARGKLVDEDGRPVTGARLEVRLESGEVVYAETGADGAFRVDAVGAGEGYQLAVLSAGRAEGRFVDPAGRPVPGVAARLHLRGGRTVSVRSDGSGGFTAELRVDEPYTLEVLEGSGEED